MLQPTQLVSPKQVARAIGVSESSLKRWCDRGLIRTVRTAGGHRKMQIDEVLAFVRDNDHGLVSPELLGLPPVSHLADLGLVRGKDRLVAALLAGDGLLSRQIVFDLFLARHPVSVIFDDVIAAAVHAIGDRWYCQQADIYEERRACEITRRIVFDLRRAQRDPSTDQDALGGTLEGDWYALPTAMVELVLRDAGYNAASLGSSIPAESMVRAIERHAPGIFWVSVSHIRDDSDFVKEFARLSRACAKAGTALVVGGRALRRELRQKMKYAAYCDTMQQLESFARTLLGSKSATGSVKRDPDRRVTPTESSRAATGDTEKPKPKRKSK